MSSINHRKKTPDTISDRVFMQLHKENYEILFQIYLDNTPIPHKLAIFTDQTPISSLQKVFDKNHKRNIHIPKGPFSALYSMQGIQSQIEDVCRTTYYGSDKLVGGFAYYAEALEDHHIEIKMKPWTLDREFVRVNNLTDRLLDKYPNGLGAIVLAIACNEEHTGSPLAPDNNSRSAITQLIKPLIRERFIRIQNNEPQY